MFKFTDKKGRIICIEVSDCCADAYFSGKRIGDVQTTGIQEVDDRCDPFPAQITGWNVDSEFRKAGIATEMVRLLCEEIGQLSPGRRDMGRGGENALTDEGMGLTLHCQALGFVLPFPDDE